MHLSVSNLTGVLYLVLNFLSSLYRDCNFTAALRRREKKKKSEKGVHILICSSHPRLRKTVGVYPEQANTD